MGGIGGVDASRLRRLHDDGVKLGILFCLLVIGVGGLVERATGWTWLRESWWTPPLVVHVFAVVVLLVGLFWWRRDVRGRIDRLSGGYGSSTEDA